MKTLYAKIKKLGQYKIQQYKEDLTKRDKAVLSKAKPGDLFLWAVRENGTHLIQIKGADDVNKNAAIARKETALKWFKAVNAQFPKLEWFFIEPVTLRHGHVFPADRMFIVKVFKNF